MSAPLLYTEKQRFSRIWLVVLFVLCNGFFWYALYMQLILGEPVGDRPMDNTTLIVMSTAMLLLTALLMAARLETTINASGITVRLFPFMLRPRQVAWADVSAAYIRQYRPIAEYGGWGIRGLGKNRALNMKGNMGLQLELSNGSRLLIGTSNPDAIGKVLEGLGKFPQQ